MIKEDLVRMVAKNTNNTLGKTREIVDGVFEAMEFIFATREDLMIRNFGKFEVKLHPAHNFKSNLTGETKSVPDRYLVKFKPADSLTEKTTKEY